MTTKEKIIIQSIEQIERQLKEINFILESNPLSEICKIRIEAKELLDKNKTVEERTSDDFIAKIEVLSKREKEQFTLAEKGKDSMKLVDEKIKLEFELYDLKNELYHIERNRVQDSPFCSCISRVGIDGTEHGKWTCQSCKKEAKK